MKPFENEISIVSIIRSFKVRVMTTWMLVVVENILIALIPLLIGMALDGLLQQVYSPLAFLSAVLIGVVFVAVARRIYDTRAFGQIRLELAAELDDRNSKLSVSTRNARIGMARELVDFMEEELPALFTAVIQIGVALVLLAMFHKNLALSAVSVMVGMMVLYAFFHNRFYHLNATLNGQMEKQVQVLDKGGKRGLFHHLSLLKSSEIKLSDTEAYLYGLIYILQFGFVVYNLWLSSNLPDMTPGKIFSILSYSWEYVEAAIMLPIALQSLSRLQEITHRINGNPANKLAAD